MKGPCFRAGAVGSTVVICSPSPVFNEKLFDNGKEVRRFSVVIVVKWVFVKKSDSRVFSKIRRYK